MTPTAARWRIRVNADPIGQQSWSMHCGLSLLHHTGEARVTFANFGLPPERGVWLEVRDRETRTTRTIVVDLADVGVVNNPRRTALADSLWKRSWTPGAGRPLGLVAGMRSGHERLARYAPTAAWTAARSSAPVPNLRRVVSSLRYASRQLLLSEYELVTPKTPVVLFQVAGWGPSTTRSPETGAAVNDDRAKLIVALRKHFGHRFVGGFIRSPFVVEEYPDLLTNHRGARRDYVSLIRSSAVAVSSKGLHGSNPWKLAEYLAAGAAIVSEPLRFGIPESLDGVARFFVDADACVAACDVLLSDPSALTEAHERSHEHWRAYTRPDALLRRRLGEEFGT